jgi:nucleotide-binding universal stress UspA family protein
MTGTATQSAEFLSRFEPVRTPTGPILVASDASPASDAAFPLARTLSMHTAATVHVISAMRPNAMPTYAFDAIPYPVVPTADVLEGRASLLRMQMDRLVPSAAPWPVTVRTGDPVREILDQAQAQEARLIVVGRGRHGLVERVLGGESVLRLLQLGETPVLAVERTLEHLPQRVVIATDFSVFSIYAAQVALDLISPHATVQLVHVAPTLHDSGPVLREFAQEYRRQAEASFVQLIERLARPGLHFESVLLEGNASTRLVEHLTTTAADLMVTATHGYGFLRRMVLGSVAAELVRTAPCSVLCVPGGAHTMAAARAQATALTAQTRLFEDATLDAELSDFSVRNSGRPCTVEVNQRAIGIRALGHHLPLVGVTFDRHSRDVTLMFGASALEGAHLSHGVPQVRTVELVGDGGMRDALLRVTHDEGETVVMLE